MVVNGGGDDAQWYWRAVEVMMIHGGIRLGYVVLRL